MLRPICRNQSLERNRESTITQTEKLYSPIPADWTLHHHPLAQGKYGCEVIAVIGDVGQQEDWKPPQKALATGASTALVEDLREEFVRDYIWPTLRAGAVTNTLICLELPWRGPSSPTPGGDCT